MPALSELVAEVVVGLGSGAFGAYLGASVERRRHVEQQEEERMAALWGLQRALRFAGDQLTLKGGGQPGPFLRDAEKAAYRYYHTLPGDIRNALEGDVPGSFQTADALLGAASKLRAYLEAEQAEAVRAEPSSVGGRVGSRFSRAWASLKES